MSKLDITKQVPLSNQLYSRVQIRINQLGIKFPEYIRHLILIDTGDIQENYLSKEEEESVGESLRDIGEGRYTQLRSEKEIEDHFKKLAKQTNE